MKKTAIYLSVGLAATTAIAVAAYEEIPNLFSQAVERAVAARMLQQQNADTPKTIRVGAGGG